MPTTAAASTMEHYSCAHCGLPVATPSLGKAPSTLDRQEIFCCHACRLVSAIVGNRQGEQGWHLFRLGIGALLAMNVMMISLLLYAGSVETQLIPLFRRILLVLSIPAMLILIPPFLSGALREISSRRFCLDFLIALGSLSAFSLSAVNAVVGSGEVYFDTATMLPVLVTLGKFIEASVKRKASELLETLETLLPRTALRVTGEGTDEVALDALQPGDLVRVRPGERVAVDGTVVEGTSSIEEAPFTGEFLPRLCRKGDAVTAGTVNGQGTLLLRADRTGSQLLLHSIADMVQQAWRAPSQSERLAQKAAMLFLPAVLLVSVGALICWSFKGLPDQALLSALSVLVVACPCTMGIATPLATSLAVARAARAGIVVRGGSVMEGIAGTGTVFFDKTGTVTSGTPVLSEMELLDPLTTRAELLGRLAALESASEHPLAAAVKAAAAACGAAPGTATQVELSAGCGISGTVTWKGVATRMWAGNASCADGDVGCEDLPGEGAVVFAGWDGRLRARLHFADPLKDDAASSLDALHRLGLTSVLLSGDRFSSAQVAAKRLGIRRVEAPSPPDRKLELIAGYIAKGRKVAMVGDGVNDAPALAAAQTGIALGTGMELAQVAGNVVILSGRLSQIPWLIALSRRAGNIIRGNLALSFAYNAVALAAAAAGLLHPLLAAVAMVVSSLTVLGNSLRIGAFPAPSALPARSRETASPQPKGVLPAMPLEEAPAAQGRCAGAGGFPA
ncbi:heavy metal-translocating P-type ATPase [Citrifermentans bemidjiense Bem]|uniref:Heavy metal-translocating P-type ATPase n=1 Tax=Citrifermentans bemidjiense (strain ATCC BAA-1014 / DSM 16622 / JCM 12645 / Bem) TaxID=404380 RepID=B5E8G2_CITBB|nr:cation-translocating P-type ATPase [Citrifermentans bemidjiense]ACH37145.1 heavy metal-translocating P-type ATPase [Citrifermentans bemidjiense Bem]